MDVKIDFVCLLFEGKKAPQLISCGALSQSEILSDPLMRTFICLYLCAGQVAYRPTSMRNQVHVLTQHRQECSKQMTMKKIDKSRTWN